VIYLLGAVWEDLHPPVGFTGVVRGPNPAQRVTVAVPSEAPCGGAHREKYNILGSFWHGQGYLRLNQHHEAQKSIGGGIPFAAHHNSPLYPFVQKGKCAKKNSFFSTLRFKKRNQGGPAALLSLQCSVLAFIDDTGFSITAFKVNQSGEREKKEPFFFLNLLFLASSTQTMSSDLF